MPGNDLPAARTVDVDMNRTHLAVEMMAFESAAGCPKAGSYRGLLKNADAYVGDGEGIVSRAGVLNEIDQGIAVDGLPVRKRRTEGSMRTTNGWWALALLTIASCGNNTKPVEPPGSTAALPRFPQHLARTE